MKNNPRKQKSHAQIPWATIERYVRYGMLIGVAVGAIALGGAVLNRPNQPAVSGFTKVIRDFTPNEQLVAYNKPAMDLLVSLVEINLDKETSTQFSQAVASGDLMLMIDDETVAPASGNDAAFEVCRVRGHPAVSSAASCS